MSIRALAVARKVRMRDDRSEEGIACQLGAGALQQPNHNWPIPAARSGE